MEGGVKDKLYSEIVLNNKLPDTRIDGDMSRFLEPLFLGEHNGAILIYCNKAGYLAFKGIDVTTTLAIGMASAYVAFQQAALNASFRPFDPSDTEPA